MGESTFCPELDRAIVALRARNEESVASGDLEIGLRTALGLEAFSCAAFQKEKIAEYDKAKNHFGSANANKSLVGYLYFCAKIVPGLLPKKQRDDVEARESVAAKLAEYLVGAQSDAREAVSDMRIEDIIEMDEGEVFS